MFWKKLLARVKALASFLRPRPPLPTPDYFANMEDTPTASNEYTNDIIVYTTYQKPPVHPGREWTRFICISDTHGRQAKLPVPEGDVLLHSGDMTAWGLPEQLEEMAGWLQSQPHPVKM